MDFSKYLQDYQTIKRLQGVTPGRDTSAKIFSPYFDQQSSVNFAGRKMDLAERAQTSQERQAGENLAWDKERMTNSLAATKENALSNLALEKWQQGLLMEQAKKNDSRATTANVINTLGTLGGAYVTGTSPYWNRRKY
jgi:hypothetical protein